MADIIASGDWWTLYSDGLLDIYRVGSMPYYSNADSVPWSRWRNSVVSVDIETSVTSIGAYAFSDCARLARITIPENVRSIGVAAFSRCYALASITIPNGVKSIGEFAFRACTALASVTIPNSVTGIGSSAFTRCTALASVTIPNSVTSIGSSAFWGCTRLASVTIPDSVTTIGNYTFTGCSSLTSVTIPDSVTSIGNYAFDACSSLTSVTIPDSVTSIGEYAFNGCSALTSVAIPDSVTNIGADAFRDCSRLTSVTIPDSITSIRLYTFYGCSSLTSVTIPDSVTNIGADAFRDCSRLTSVTIPDSVTTIGNYAFSGCAALASVTIPDSVTSIRTHTFDGCSSLTSVTIPDSVTSIETFAFFNCGLTSVTIPLSVTSIGSNAFRDCALVHVYYPGFAYDWERINIASGNESLSRAIMHYIPPVLHIGGSLDGTKIVNAQLVFSTSDYDDLSYTQSLSMDGNEVQSDELYAEIHVEQNPETWLSQWADVSRTVPVWRTRYGTQNGKKTVTVIEDHEKYYFKSLKRVSRKNFLLTAQSPVGRLTADYPGGLYEGRQDETLSGVLADIMGDIPHNIDERLDDFRVYGWLPYQSWRKCVHMLALAYGFLIRRDSNCDLFFTLPGSEAGLLLDDVIFNGGSVDYRIGSAYAGVEVTEYTFLPTPNDKEVTLFDNTNGSPAAVEQIVRFSDAPVHDITASGGLTVHWSNVNAAMVSGIGVLTGKAYTVINSVLSVPGDNPNADPDNILSIDGVPLITSMNSETVAQKYLSSVNAPVVEMDFIRRGENTGDYVSFTDPYGAERTGYLLSMSGRVTSLERVTGTFLAGYAPVWGNTYNDVILLTDSGEWAVPDALDGATVRVVLISGGQGGASGQHGSDDTASGCGHGSPGDGGLVNIVKTAVHAGDVFAYHCGAGGAGGVPSDDTTVTVYAGTRYHLKSDCDAESGTLTPVTLAEAVERELSPCDTCVNAEDTRKATQYVSNPGSLGEATTFGGFSSDDGAPIPTGYRDMIHGAQYAEPGPDNGIDGGKATTATESGDRLNPIYTDVERPTVILPWDPQGFEWPSGNPGRSRYLYQTGENAFNDWAYGGLGGGAAAGHEGGSGYDAPAGSSADIGGDGGNGADADTVFPNDTRVYGAGGSGGHGGGEGGMGGTGHSTTGSWARDGHRGAGGSGSSGQAGKAGCILIYFHG